MTTDLTLDALRRDSRVLWTEDVLRYGDTDANGHVNNSTFSVLCESGRVHFFMTALDPTLDGGPTFFVIARLAIEFRAELHYPGTVLTGTWVSRLGRTSITVAQALFAGDRLAATSEGVCVLMDKATRRPTPFPEATRRAAERFWRSAALISPLPGGEGQG